MKQNRIIGIILAAVNAVLIVCCIVMYLRTDRKAPRIEFQSTNAVYKHGEENTVLTMGITAYDSKDGDVTDRLVIEKLIENEKENTVTVFYAVSDRAGNVAKASRVFPAVYTKDSEKDRNTADSLLEAGIVAELKGTKEQTENIVEKEQDTFSEPMETPEPTQTLKPAQTPEPAKTPQPKPAITPRTEPVSDPPAAPSEDPAAPVLTLKLSEVHVTAGQGPAWVDVIDVLRDDKDSYEMLFGNLSVSKYDRNKPGSYPVTVWTEDSDGNKSKTVPLTIVVK